MKVFHDGKIIKTKVGEETNNIVPSTTPSAELGVTLPLGDTLPQLPPGDGATNAANAALLLERSLLVHGADFAAKDVGIRSLTQNATEVPGAGDWIAALMSGNVSLVELGAAEARRDVHLRSLAGS